MEVKLMACVVGTEASDETVTSELSNVVNLDLVRKATRRRDKGGPMARSPLVLYLGGVARDQGE